MNSTPLVIFVMLLSSSLGTAASHRDRPPNIIFLLADDLRWNALGCMGNEHVVTPHIDRMAQEGVTFSHAYHVSPICLPSRSSIMLGQYLGTHGSGFTRPTNHIVTESEFATSYPVLQREAGYFTGFIGKFGFAVGPGPKRIRKGEDNNEAFMPKNRFDRWYGFPGQGSYHPRQDGTFNGYANQWQAKHLNEFMGYQAIDFIERAVVAGRPFSLSISFKAPHAPFEPEPQFRELYDTKTIPRTINDDPTAFEKLPQAVREQSRNAKWYFGRGNNHRRHWNIVEDSVYQAFIKNYYALITGIDDVVGRIRSHLKEKGLSENTVILLTSDNGFFCGSRQLMGKALLYDESARAPMIVADPRLPRSRKGQVENALVSHIDIAPTLLNLSGIDKPTHMPGTTLVPLLTGQQQSIHDAVYGENNFSSRPPLLADTAARQTFLSIRSKFVRTPSYKYIRYHECQPPVEELFHVQEDRLEFSNLIDDPEYARVAKNMRIMLDEFERRFCQYGASIPARNP